MPKLSSSLYLSQGDLREHPPEESSKGRSHEIPIGQDFGHEEAVGVLEQLATIKSRGQDKSKGQEKFQSHCGHGQPNWAGDRALAHPGRALSNCLHLGSEHP